MKSRFIPRLGTRPRAGRRRFLAMTAVMAASRTASAADVSLPDARPSLPGIRALIEYLAGREPRFGAMALEVPRVADNGNAVPMRIVLAGPFTATRSVRKIRLFSEKNPYPEMASFEFPVPLPSIDLESRIRLAGSQRIAAIAELADGSLYAAVADVSVTIAACLDGT
jgi:sulfur-oxidizing protein SoxY